MVYIEESSENRICLEGLSSGSLQKKSPIRTCLTTEDLQNVFHPQKHIEDFKVNFQLQKILQRSFGNRSPVRCLSKSRGNSKVFQLRKTFQRSFNYERQVKGFWVQEELQRNGMSQKTCKWSPIHRRHIKTLLTLEDILAKENLLEIFQL